jgi:hypothetical protein
MNTPPKSIAVVLLLVFRCLCRGADDAPANPPVATVVLEKALSAEALEQKMLAMSDAGGGALLLPKGSILTAIVHSDIYKQWRSPHALLVPEHVTLDLNGSTVLLDLRENSYGIRLTSWSAIRNGTIRVVRSEYSGSQGIWHTAVSVGAAYGDGGTTDRPSYFSKLVGWRMENLDIDQPFKHSAIQIMSESAHGVIRDIRIADSKLAALGIGLDWGTIGPIGMADANQPKMGILFRQKKIRSAHPHDILIQKIRIGRLESDVNDDDSAGIRASGCYNITIDDVEIEEANDGVAVHAGDAGYEYAVEPDRSIGHAGYVIKNITVHKARRKGIHIDGFSDNIFRSYCDYGYLPMISPVTPGINRPVVQDVRLSGDGSANGVGLAMQYSVGAKVERIDVGGFRIGVRFKNWTKNIVLADSRIHDNGVAVLAIGPEEKPENIVLTHNRLYNNGKEFESAPGQVREVDDIHHE